MQTLLEGSRHFGMITVYSTRHIYRYLQITNHDCPHIFEMDCLQDLPCWWPCQDCTCQDCYKNDDQTHAFGMGVAIGSKLFSVFSNKDREGTDTDNVAEEVVVYITASAPRHTPPKNRILFRVYYIYFYIYIYNHWFLFFGLIKPSFLTHTFRWGGAG